MCISGAFLEILITTWPVSITNFNFVFNYRAFLCRFTVMESYYNQNRKNAKCNVWILYCKAWTNPHYNAWKLLWVESTWNMYPATKVSTTFYVETTKIMRNVWFASSFHFIVTSPIWCSSKYAKYPYPR